MVGFHQVHTESIYHSGNALRFKNNLYFFCYTLLTPWALCTVFSYQIVFLIRSVFLMKWLCKILVLISIVFFYKIISRQGGWFPRLACIRFPTSILANEVTFICPLRDRAWGNTGGGDWWGTCFSQYLLILNSQSSE